MGLGYLVLPGALLLVLGLEDTPLDGWYCKMVVCFFLQVLAGRAEKG